MYKLGEILMFISVLLFVIAGIGALIGILKNPLLGSYVVFALIFLGAGTGIKKKYTPTK